MTPSSILLAEPCLLLREKIAGVLGRSEAVWCVVQVGCWESLYRVAPSAGADLVLVDLKLVRDPERVAQLRRAAPGARLIGLADTASEAYQRAARDVGLDSLVARACVLDAVRPAAREGSQP